MIYAVLKTLIDSRDDCTAFAADGSHAAIADILNAKTEMGTRFVPCPELLNWAMQQGIWFAVEDAGNDPTTPEPIRTACRTTIKAIDSPRYQEIDLTGNPKVQEMLQALVIGGLMTQDQYDDVIALATIAVSPVEVAFGQGTKVSVYDVSRAIRGYD